MHSTPCLVSHIWDTFVNNYGGLELTSGTAVPAKNSEVVEMVAPVGSCSYCCEPCATC
jgi:hypothetical protein